MEYEHKDKYRIIHTNSKRLKNFLAADEVVAFGHRGCGFESCHRRSTSSVAIPLLATAAFLRTMNTDMSLIKEVTIEDENKYSAMIA